MSRPAPTSRIAAEWRMTWGDTRFSTSVGQKQAAISAYLATRRSRASRLSWVPRRVGNNGSASTPARSAIQTSSILAVLVVICDPLPAALADAAHVCTRPEVHIVDPQGNEFACSQAGLAGECQHRPVTSPGPGALVRRRK
jgi:hypothetical protein